jgi:hypothetical protein
MGFNQPLTEMSAGNIKENNDYGEYSAAGAWG